MIGACCASGMSMPDAMIAKGPFPTAPKQAGFRQCRRAPGRRRMHRWR